MKIKTIILLILLGIIFLYIGIVINIAWQNGDFNSTIIYKPDYLEMINFTINLTPEK